jgi:replicative DNA helicase
MKDRIPPQALEMEQAVLGAAMIQRDALMRIADVLRPEMFYEPRHRTIYAACLDLANNGSAVDILTVTQQLMRQGLTEASGGPFYLTQLTSRVASAANIEHHAHYIAEKWMLRGMIDIGTRMAQLAYEGETDVFDLMEQMDTALLALGQVGQGTEIEHREALRLMLKNLEDVAAGRAAPAMPFGFSEVDSLMGGGGREGDLVIVAARPSMGKSVYAVNVATNVAKLGYPVYFVSLEMSTQQQVERQQAQASSTSMGRIRSPQYLQSTDWARLTMGASDTQTLPILWDSPGTLNATQLRAKAMRWARKAKVQKGKGLIVLDYLQLMDGTGKAGNREQDVSHISRSLKQIARETGVTVLALSQLSRKCEDRTDKRPILSDLRESGAIEQDADLVQFIYRPAVYEGSDDRTAEIIQAKGRGAGIGTAFLDFYGEYASFRDKGNPLATPSDPKPSPF